MHAQALDRLMQHADEPTRQRLNFLTTPHATAWLSSLALLKVTTQCEFVCGLKWASGLKFREQPYTCNDCGRQADPYGMHAVTCQRYGAVCRGHFVLRDTVAELLARAGIAASPEKHLPGSLDLPVDRLVLSWRRRTVAIDFTVVTPTRASAASTVSTSTTTLMDQAAKQKDQKRQQACEAAGWAFQPFVADT